MIIHVKKNIAMKKIYQIPEINVVKIQTLHILAGSLKYGDETEATEGNAAKSGGFWSDDEPEEEYTKW